MATSVSGSVPPADAAAARRRRGRWVAAGIFAVCAFPVIAGYVAYYFLPPQGRVNYGDLLETRPLPSVTLTRLDGTPLRLDALRGKWLMMQVDAAACDERCQGKLFNMRQVRLAQGKDMDRIERVWLVADAAPPPAAIERLYEGAVLARAPGELIAALPAEADVRDHVYLVDPLGNMVLRFPPNADPKKMIKDLQRLLKYSGIG